MTRILYKSMVLALKLLWKYRSVTVLINIISLKFLKYSVLRRKRNFTCYNFVLGAIIKTKVFPCIVDVK